MKNQNSTLFSCFSSSIRQFALFLCCMFFAVEAYAVTATFTFTGTTDSDWATATNWDLGTVPTSADIVVIAASKSVIISNVTTVTVEKMTLNSGASLTNNGTLTIAPGLNTAGATTGSALTISGANTFDNEGTLTVTSANQNAVQNAITLNGIGNTLTFNGTNNLAAKAGSNNVFAAGTNATATIGGTGFTIGAPGAGVAFGIITNTSPGATITIASGTTINLYLASSNGIYMANSATVTNNGKIVATATATGSVRALNMWETTTATTTTFNNNGEFQMLNFDGPMVLGGTSTAGFTGYCTFKNAGTLTISGNLTTGGTALGLASTNIANIFTNSGFVNLSAKTSAIVLPVLSGGFTNTGIITITKGNIYSGAAAGSYPTINNNSGGVFNFNYGVSGGSTSAISQVILKNNSGATINGSCTFAANTLVTAAGSTLSPGDYTGGVSGIGTIVLTPSATSTKFPLAGSVLMQIKGKTTPGTDFDKISCTEIDVTAATLTVTATYTSYTPALNDYLTLIYAGTSKTGPFSSTFMPKGWLYESVSTNEAAKYYPSVPSAPTIGTAVAGNGQVLVPFTAPTSDGGADITLYTVTSNDGKFATGTTSPIVVIGLTNETAYTFTVTATNISGTSLASLASNSATPSLNTAIENQNRINELITVEGRTINLHGATGMVNVFNSVGRLVVSEKTSNRNIELKSKGIYLIK